MAESPRSILSWLRRCRRDELSVDRVLESIHSIYGVIPLGGCMDSTDGVTLPATSKRSVLTLFSASKNALLEHKSGTTKDETNDWTLLLRSVQLPSKSDQQELQQALEMLQDEEKNEKKPLSIETLRQKFFTMRRLYFEVRIELLRVARDAQHPSNQAAQEIVQELLKEGLQDVLLDEMHSRQFYDLPVINGVGRAENKALEAWELQFLEEETLLRELLLLTLVVTTEKKTTLYCAVKIAKTVQNWETRIRNEVFTANTLAMPKAQQLIRKLTQIGVLVALKLLYNIEDTLDYEDLRQVTKNFFLTESSGLLSGELVTSSVPGVLLLAWAAVLGRQYRKMTECNRKSEEIRELKSMLETTLAAAERLHSFYYLHSLLCSLIFSIDKTDSSKMERKPFLLPMSVHAKTLWELPNVPAFAGLCGANTTLSQQLIGSNSAFVYQDVVAEFLNDMLSSLGYMDNIDGVQQLHAMVKFVLPAVSNVRVAKQILGIDMEESNMVDIMNSGEIAALRILLTKTRVYLPHSLLPCVQMFTALCYNDQNYTSPSVIRQVLKYFSSPRAGLEGETTTGVFCRPLPPTEYFAEIQDEPDQLQCTRAFAYDDADGRLVVPVGTVGMIVGSSDVVQVKWLLSDSNEGKNAFSLWDLLFLNADRFVAGLQSGSFADLHRTNSEDMHVLTSFFEFIVQLGQGQDGEQFAVKEMTRRWGEARLRHWWVAHQLPSPEVYVSQLLRQKIALPTLLLASRENLVSWRIRDRYIREQILVQIGDTKSLGSGNTKMALNSTSTMTSYSVDGGIHLLRLLLGVLDGFLHKFPRDTDNDAMKGQSAGFAMHLHLVAASFIALRTILATTSGVELLMNSSLGGGQEECINLIVKSAKKFFEVQERLTGEYPVVLATQDIFMSVVRWFLSKEVQLLANLSKSEDKLFSREFVASERLWYVSAAEFAIEVLSTHEGWKFVTTTDRCEVKERCFRLLYVLVLPRKCTQKRNDMVLAFKSALRGTLATDMPLLIKLLRSSCAVLSPMKGHRGHWNRYSLADNNEDSEVSSINVESHKERFPLKYKSEIDRDGDNMMQLESLVTTCLRLVAFLITSHSNVVDAPAARKILLAPIYGGGSKERNLLTIVTLCGGYLEYSLEKAPGIVYWSLQILQHAAVALDYHEERESRNLSSMHSLIALFHGYQDLDVVRGKFAHLLQVSSTHQSALRKEVIEFLTLCLEHQPGFLALLLFGEERAEGSKSEDTTKEKVEGDPFSFVTLLERFFESSERLLEQASDLLCALLAFLVQVWKGAIQHRLVIHLKIMTALRARPAFWLNVTRALKIHMSLNSVEERGLLDMELAAATAEGVGNLQSPSNLSEVYIGRSSAYGYMARSLILQLVSYEWHDQVSKQKDHPLVDVLKSFGKEGLFSHWSRTFTHLDYSPAQLELYASSIDLNMLTTNLLSDISARGISMYIEGLICNTSTLKWQLSAGGDFRLEASPADVRMLKLGQWSNLQAAYLHAQLFLLSKWKVFMELCCLQTSGAAHSTPDVDTSSELTTLRQSKRKDSTILSPPRNSGTDSTPSMGATSREQLTASASSTSTSESTPALPSSLIFGDRTSFEMIRVVADVIKARVNQHENQDQVLDYFVLLHLHDLVQLLVSMLQHQLCLVVRKTRDPKLSQTRQHLNGSSAEPNFACDAGATFELLAVVEKAISAVHDSMDQIVCKVDLVGLGAKSHLMSAPSIKLTFMPLISHLVTDYTQRVESVTGGLLTSLFTAALLLMRHLSKINNHKNVANKNVELESISPPKSLLQMKLIGRCMNVIASCDDNQPQLMTSSRTLFQLSRCLFQEVLDSFISVDASVSSIIKLRTYNVLQLNPLVKKLEHEEHGIGALFHLLVQRFRLSQYDKEVTAKQEEACQTLRGLVAVVWNPTNSELCQRTMLKGKSSSYPASRLRLISILATQLLPLLQTQMEREEAITKLRGYKLSVRDSNETDHTKEKENLERSIAHQMWCLVLDFVGGLVRLQANLTGIASDDVDVWGFMSSAEPLLLSAVEPGICQRLTAATIAEHQALLRLLNALSGTATRRKRWREAFPTNCVVLMEHSRQLLWRACVLLGSSSVENGRLRAERMQKEKRDKSVSQAIMGFGASRTSKSPQSPRSPSAFTYAHQTLLYDHLQAVEDDEKRKLAEFHRELETELVVVVQLASSLLIKWTASLADRNVVLVVDGVRRVDEEQLVPLLALIPPSEARSMNSSPGVGHLCLAMDFVLDQLLAEEDSLLKPHTTGMKTVLVNAINACALLFLKTFLLYFEQYELVKRDCDELNRFFRQFNARLSKDDTGSSVGVDVELIQHISKVCLR
ncbi:unnamed protein product [Peronospora farinosa]|uniref:Uncharacterized protein n=1 Tax=Peronospora farinosa TaxID=134698 RepID=A0ABN8BY36_9STRA|nr:unnamed protein product [Peronospora farinosa]